MTFRCREAVAASADYRLFGRTSFLLNVLYGTDIVRYGFERGHGYAADQPANHNGGFGRMGPKGALAHSRTSLDAPNDSINGKRHHHAPVFFGVIILDNPIRQM